MSGQQTTPDPFLAAFDSLVSLPDTASSSAIGDALAASAPAADTTPTDPPADTVAGSEGADTPADTAEGADTPAEGEGTDGGEGAEGGEGEGTDTQAGGEAQDKPPTTPDDDDLLRRLSNLIRKTPAGEETQDRQPAGADSTPAEADKPQPPPKLYSAEEEEFLNNYVKDWPDVAKAEALLRRAEAYHMMNHIFTEVAKFVVPHIEQVQALAQRAHLTDLETRVQDYDTVRDKVIEWVDAQPKYLRAAYQQVINEGTADEVTDLINRWRKETGVQPAAATTTPAPKKTELPPAAKQAAAALAPVGSKRSAPAVGGVDPNDFEGAFALAAKADKV